MMKKISALYDHFDAADLVVEALLDRGFSHLGITLKSGDYWYEEPGASNAAGDASTNRLHLNKIEVQRSKIYLQVLASSEQEKLARELICNSGPVEVREHILMLPEAWEVISLPVVVQVQEPVPFD